VKGHDSIPFPQDEETPLSETSEEELMCAYIGGRKEAFQELFSRLGPLLTSVARRRMGGDDQVRDVVQQTFLQVHRARFDFDRSALLRPWLITIELNIIRERRRRAIRRPLGGGSNLTLQEVAFVILEKCETRYRT